MGIFSREERSEIWRFLGRFRNSPGWPERKTEACGVRIFSRISTTGNGVVKKVRACAPEAA